MRQSSVVRTASVSQRLIVVMEMQTVGTNQTKDIVPVSRLKFSDCVYSRDFFFVKFHDFFILDMNIYRITAILKVETDIIATISASPMEYLGDL
jgi:hypothetical protein